MRRFLVCLTVLCCCALGAAPALAQGPANSSAGQPASQAAKPSAKQASLPDVLEYIRLFGYREMLEQSAERQLASIVDLVRQERPDVAKQTLDIIHQELRTELKAASERSVREMAGVFQRHFSREDIAYLLTVGRDPRMQKVVLLQPKIAVDLEGIGERLADDIAAKAAPRIEERLRLADEPKV